MSNQTENELRRSEATVRAIVETAVTAIITIDAQGAIRSFNPAAERLFGYQAEEIVGSNVKVLMPEPYHSEHDGYLARYAKTGVARVIGIGREVVCRRRDGSAFPADLAVSAVAVEGERLFVGILTDISERKRLEAELRASEAHFRRMADSSPIMIWTTNNEGNPTFTNRTWLDFVGLDATQASSHNEWLKTIHPDDVKKVLTPYQGTVNKHPISIEYRLRRKDGAWRWVLDCGMPLQDEQGSLLGYIGSAIDITERKQAEENLRRSEATVRAIVDTAVTAIITIDAQGAIRSFNPAAERLFGYQAEEIAGSNVNVLMPEPYHSEHDGYLARYMKTGVARIIGIGREVVCRRCDGSVFPADLAVSAVAVEGERLFVGILTDISERKHLESDLREHRDHLEELVATQTAEVRAIVQTAVNGIITIDERGLVHIFNPAAELIFGYKASEVAGRNVSMLMPEPYHSQHDDYLQNFLRSGNKKIIGIGREVTGRRKNGSTFPMYLAVGHAMLSQGKNLFVGFVSDITKHKQAELALREAKEAAEAGARAKAAFIANMSHEIRTPMNAILGFSEVVLQNAGLPPETQRHVRTIYGAAKSLLDIINDILDVSKLESGKFTLETVCFHLPNALADAFRTMEQRAAEKNLTLDIEYDIHLPIRFMGDPSRLRQVVLNLVGNAIKFTAKGGVTLRVEPGSQPDMVHFAVTDSGIGMTPEQLARVFEPFSQADTSTTRRFGGTGLGTTISKQIVGLMGGEIRVDSEFGVGSTFHFTARLPAATITDDCLYEGAEDVAEDYVSPRLFRILLAEDIEANATLALLRLEQQGHSVYWAQTGRAAVEAFRTEAYDLILMDVQMPELDGMDATRAIRALEAESAGHIPILALTASVMREDSNNCLEAGMDGVIAKPIHFNELFAEMEKIVPSGHGRTRATLRINTVGDAPIDFSPLDGIVDHVKGLKTWRNAAAYAKALVSFADERGADADKITRLSADDTEAASMLAHALKGVAGNLAVNRVAAAAAAVDAALKSARRDSFAALSAELGQELAQAVAAIARLHLSMAQPETPTQAFDQSVVCGLLRELCNALSELNPDSAEPLLDRLGAYLSRNELAGIRRELECFDFDAAIQQTHLLAAKLGLNL